MNAIDQPTSTKTKSEENSDRFPDTYICACGKVQDAIYDHRVHLFSCQYVSCRTQGFCCSCKRTFHDKTKWAAHISQCKGWKKTMLNPVICAKPYCYPASDNKIIAKVQERCHEELDKNPNSQKGKARLLPSLCRKRRRFERESPKTFDTEDLNLGRQLIPDQTYRMKEMLSVFRSLWTQSGTATRSKSSAS